MQYFNGTDYDTLYPQVNLSNVSGSIDINNISGNLPATRVSYSNSSTSSIITGSNVQLAIDQLFQSVSNGKSQIASAITDKGVSTSSSASFSTMASNIRRIETQTNLLYSTVGDITIGSQDYDQVYGTTTPVGRTYEFNFRYGGLTDADRYRFLFAICAIDGGAGHFVEVAYFDKNPKTVTGTYGRFNFGTRSEEYYCDYTFLQNPPDAVRTNSIMYYYSWLCLNYI